MPSWKIFLALSLCVGWGFFTSLYRSSFISLRLYFSLTLTLLLMPQFSCCYVAWCHHLLPSLLLIIVDCSQTKFCSNYINPAGLLCNFSSDPLDFSASERGLRGSDQWALRYHRAFQLTSLPAFCQLS